jgi:uncharacterized protein (DUF1810 family)
MTSPDPFDLQRFVTAQEPVFQRALQELREGWKRTHWMWFIFPQLRGLGVSHRAIVYGIDSLDEARAYLAHPILGPRLSLCTEAVLGYSNRTLFQIFGSPDDMKFRSSMTLFAVATAEQDERFRLALERYCDGHQDPQTLALLVEAPNRRH